MTTLLDLLDANNAEPAPAVDPLDEREARHKAIIDEAVARAESNANPAWRASARDALRHVMDLHPTFTAHDVWIRLEEMGVAKPHEESAMGAILRTASRDGVIVGTGRYVASRLPQCHRDVKEWRSVDEALKKFTIVKKSAGSEDASTACLSSRLAGIADKQTTEQAPDPALDDAIPLEVDPLNQVAL